MVRSNLPCTPSPHPPRAACRVRRRRRPARATALLASVLVLSALAGLAGSARAEDLPRADEDTSLPTPTFKEAVSVSWALVPVVVRTRDGYASGLGHQDFRLWVDGHRVPIDDVDLGADAPLSVVWLQDLSGSMANSDKLAASRQAFNAFLAGYRPGDEIAIADFAGGQIQVEVPFTDSVQTLHESAETWEGYGTTALHDAVSLIPEISAEGSRGKRIAILVTDGQDNASHLTPEEAIDLVRRARIPVYVLGLRAFRPAPGKNSREKVDDAVRYADLLSRLAERTGGRYVELTTEPPGPDTQAAAHKGADQPVADAVAQILDDLRLRYILAVTTAGDGPSSYHQIRVEVTRPSLAGRGGRQASLTYRRGYWGTEPLALEER